VSTFELLKSPQLVPGKSELPKRSGRMDRALADPYQSGTQPGWVISQPELASWPAESAKIPDEV